MLEGAKALGLTGHERVLVIGSQDPWAEAILLYAGAGHVTTLEFKDLQKEVVMSRGVRSSPLGTPAACHNVQIGSSQRILADQRRQQHKQYTSLPLTSQVFTDVLPSVSIPICITSYGQNCIKNV